MGNEQNINAPLEMKNKFILISCLAILLISCNYDIVENNFKNYNEMKKENYFEKGWIPIQLKNTKMTNIFIRNDLDINTCIFSYNLPIEEIEKLERKQLKLRDNSPVEMRIIGSSKFEREIQNLPKYTSNRFEHGIAIDKVNNKVYGWIN